MVDRTKGLHGGICVVVSSDEVVCLLVSPSQAMHLSIVPAKIDILDNMHQIMKAFHAICT